MRLLLRTEFRLLALMILLALPLVWTHGLLVAFKGFLLFFLVPQPFLIGAQISELRRKKQPKQE